jgi:Legume lectin domain
MHQQSFSLRGIVSARGLVAAFALLACVTLACVSRAAAAPVGEPLIAFPDESNPELLPAGLQLNGSAEFRSSSPALQLTPAESYKRGSVFSRTELLTGGSFRSAFELEMHGSTDGPADGMAFVIQGDNAEALGRNEMAYGCISPSLEVEFDIYPYNLGDPPKQHIALMENGNPAEHLQYDDELPFELYGSPVEAWVEYEADTQMLSVYASPAPEEGEPEKQPEKPLFTYQVNLEALLQGPAAYVGFTASTGLYDAVQEVRRWNVEGASSTGPDEVRPLSSAGACGSGSGSTAGSSGSSGGSSASNASSGAPALHSTSTQLECRLSQANGWDLCSATVRDVAPSPSDPGGSVSFASSKGGSFSTGRSCALAPIGAGSPGSSGCSVRFLPPSGRSSGKPMTATYAGDGTHGASAGQAGYVPASSLASDVTISSSAKLSPRGTEVEAPVSCKFACVVRGEASSLVKGGVPFSTRPSALALPGSAIVAVGATFDASRRKTSKAMSLGRGTLSLKKPGRGILRIRLDPAARRALRTFEGPSFKVLVTAAVRTSYGTAVKSEKKTVTVRPRPKGGGGVRG